MKIEIKKIHSTAKIPKVQTVGSAAVDLCALHTGIIYPFDRLSLHTGIAIHIHDSSVVGLIYPRSGMAIKHGVTLVNSVGVIDSDYQGEIIVCLVNSGEHTFRIVPGQRIAQMIFQKILQVQFFEVKDFVIQTNRGVGGFGSTGK